MIKRPRRQQWEKERVRLEREETPNYWTRIWLCTQPSVRGALNPFKFRTIALFLKSFRAECFLHPVEQAQKSNTASENTNSSSTRRADLFVCLERQHYPPGKTRLHRAAYRFSLHVFISLLMGAFYGVVVFVQNARKVSLTAWPVG